MVALCGYVELLFVILFAKLGRKWKILQIIWGFCDLKKVLSCLPFTFNVAAYPYILVYF